MNKPNCLTHLEVADHVNPNKRCQVYRNLHKNCFSIRQDGRVVAHAQSVALKDCRFLVGKAGQEKVRREKKKNVHATISGFIDRHTFVEYAQNFFDRYEDHGHAYYNPYKTDNWQDIETKEDVDSAEYVWLNLDSSKPVAFIQEAQNV